MLTTNSRVLAVYRDVPYYQLIFQGPGETQITSVILYNFNGSIEVMSATSKQVPSAQAVQSNTVQQRTQTTQTTTAPSATVSSQVQASTQAQNQVQSSTTASSNQAVQSQTTNQNVQSQSFQQTTQPAQPAQPAQPILQQQATTVQNSTQQSTVSAQIQQTASSEPAFVQIKKADSNNKPQVEPV